MIEFLQKIPSKKTSWVMLIFGFVVFLPVYTYNVGLLKLMPFNMYEYADVISSFNTQSLKNLLQSVVDQRQLQTFRLIYILNIISTTGLATGLSILCIMIIRKFKINTRLSVVSFLFLLAVLAVAFLDYLFSVVFLTVMGNPICVKYWHTFIICSTYVVRIVMIYFVFLWLLFSAVYFAVIAIRKK